MKLPIVGTASSPTQVSTRLPQGNPSRRLEPLTHHQAHQGGDDGTRSEHRERNPRHGGCNDQEGSGPKAFGSNMHDACFLKRFRVSNNIVKYDGKTNPNIWLEDYCLACRAGGADDDLFIIQFLPIYLLDMAKVWLDHLPRKTINC
jgi:hypothetical protein